MAPNRKLVGNCWVAKYDKAAAMGELIRRFKEGVVLRETRLSAEADAESSWPHRAGGHRCDAPGPGKEDCDPPRSSRNVDLYTLIGSIGGKIADGRPIAAFFWCASTGKSGGAPLSMMRGRRIDLAHWHAKETEMRIPRGVSILRTPAEMR